MAFIDFSDATHPTHTNRSVDHSAFIQSFRQNSPLTLQESRVIELARNDSLQSLRAPRKRGWFARLILGPQPASSMLANERLEALRRLAVHTWHKGYQLPASALKDAQAAGFSEDEIGAVIDFIGRTRAPFQRIAA